MSKPVSVVIPAYNEAETLPNILADIANQSYPRIEEVIVVDNASTDQTAQVATSTGATVIAEPRKGTRYAYDSGCRNAQTEYIIIVNADTSLPPNWIEVIMKYYDDPQVTAVGSRVRFNNCPVYVNWFWNSLHVFSILLLKLGYNGGQRTLWGAAMSTNRKTFELTGGFNHGTDTNEDMVYSNLASKHGKVIYSYRTVAFLDGRRYSGNPLTALLRWAYGVGGNSLSIGMGMGSRIKSFVDVRKQVPGN